MILTGEAIRQSVENSTITFEPFSPDAINPNSINYRLGERIVKLDAGEDGTVKASPVEYDGEKFLLRKGNVYLGHTHEVIGSSTYVASLIGRSSVGRLGLFVQISANLGQMGSAHRWTLELFPALDIYVYPGQVLGQVSFWTAHGATLEYRGWFGRHNDPMLSKQHDSRFIDKGVEQ